MGRFLVVSLLAVGFSLAAGAATTSAHFDASARYTHRGCSAGASTRSDPVNVVFHGWGTWGRAASQVESHAGWKSTSGSGQLFLDHGACSVQHVQRASGEASRFHVRLRGQHWDPALGWAAAAAAHHEDLVLFPLPCGHAVDANGPGGSGFDQGRDALAAAFAVAGHATSRAWWGNTQSFKQCDGDYAASDGWTVFVGLHQVNHA
jgi:hypothetical protein